MNLKMHPGISNEERDNMWESSKDTSYTSENTSMNEEVHACGYFIITVQSNQFASYYNLSLASSSLFDKFSQKYCPWDLIGNIESK